MPVICLPDERIAELVGPLPPGVEVVLWSGEQPVPERVEDVELLVFPFANWTLPPARLFARMPKLRLAQLTSAGFDHVLPALPAGVLLSNGRGIHGGSTSEWALAVILASLREIPRFVLAQHEGRWDYTATDELADKTVLIIGAGDLGQQTARRLRAFDATPVLVGRSAREGVHGEDEIPTLLPAADIVVLVVPRTPQTEGLVDATFLAAMKDGALLVNAARGPVVVTEDLVAELASGRLRAALDVTDPEPLPAGHPLWTAPNLIITPHVGGSVFGFERRAAALVREQIGRYVAGEDLLNLVS